MIILLLFPVSCLSKREIFLIFTDCRFDGSVENVLGKNPKNLTSNEGRRSARNACDRYSFIRCLPVRRLDHPFNMISRSPPINFWLWYATQNRVEFSSKLTRCCDNWQIVWLFYHPSRAAARDDHSPRLSCL